MMDLFEVLERIVINIDLKSLNESQLCDLSSRLLDELNRKQSDEERYQSEIVKRDHTIAHLSLRNEQLTHELAILKRHKFDRMQLWVPNASYGRRYQREARLRARTLLGRAAYPKQVGLPAMRNGCAKAC